METIRLLFVYSLIFVAGATVGALWHKRILVWIERFCAIIKTWYIDVD